MKKICICGGGSLGHICLAVLSNQKDVEVNLLTGKPSQWNHEITVTDINNIVYNSKINIITDNPEFVIPQSSIVLFCLPGFAIKGELEKIKPFLNQETVVGSIVSSTGFFFCAHEILGTNAKLFGFQRVPFIARINEYGKSANLLGYKSSLNIAVENVDDPELLRSDIENLFKTPTVLLSSFYEAALTNSNPILHTGRLYSMWHDWDGIPYDHCILFYKEWTKDAAQLLINMDREFMCLLDKLPMNKKVLPTLLDYYESKDAESLALKLRSIKAFQTIKAPMRKLDGGWVPDYGSRYFIEDFPYGLKFIHDLSHIYRVDCPYIDTVYEWGMKIINLN